MSPVGKVLMAARRLYYVPAKATAFLTLKKTRIGGEEQEARRYQSLATVARCLHASTTDQEAFRAQPLFGE